VLKKKLAYASVTLTIDKGMKYERMNPRATKAVGLGDSRHCLGSVTCHAIRHPEYWCGGSSNNSNPRGTGAVTRRAAELKGRHFAYRHRLVDRENSEHSPSLLFSP
jgi:hypothetical protein